MNTINSRLSLSALLAMGFFASGCTTVVGVQPGQYPPSLPPQPVAPGPSDGTIYQTRSSLVLFEDVKARSIGDTITIVFNERMQASKNAATDASKTSDFDSGTPTLAGGTPTLNGNNILENIWETEQNFSGAGSSSQSNSLDGRITVTVSDVLPNGNLVVRGEKWLTLNQGEEYVQISGIVRTRDLDPNNEIPSFRVADARITYSGNGAVQDSSKPGILTRAFLKFWPL